MYCSHIYVRTIFYYCKKVNVADWHYQMLYPGHFFRVWNKTFTESWRYRVKSRAQHSKCAYLNIYLTKLKVIVERKQRVVANIVLAWNYWYTKLINAVEMATNLTQVAKCSIDPSNNRCINCIPYLCIHEINLEDTNFSRFRTTTNKNKKPKNSLWPPTITTGVHIAITIPILWVPVSNKE